MRDCRLVRWTREGRSGTSFLWFAVSETEPLSLHKSAKGRNKNPNSLRSDMRIFASNADLRKLKGSKSPANANQRRLVPELVAAGPGNNETTMDGRDRVAVVRYW